MYRELLGALETAVRKRSPALAESLLPGLPEGTIAAILQETGVTGETEPIRSLYSWHNGMELGPATALTEASLFPRSVYTFPSLDEMLIHREQFSGLAQVLPAFAEWQRRFFPVFWDGATGYMALDLDSRKGRVILLDPEWGAESMRGYASFEEFVADAIRANDANDELSC